MSLLGGLGSLVGIESGKRKQAEELRRQALEQAQTQADLTKQMYLDNSEAISGLNSDLFGPSIEELAQASADRNAALAAEGGYAGTTKSGRRGSFDFGNPDAAPTAAPAAPTSNTSARSGNPEYAWDENGNAIQLPNGSTLAGKQIPSGTVNLAGPGGSAHPLTAPAATKAKITAADRAAAQRQAEANYKNTLPGQLDASLGRRQGVVDQFINDINGIKSVDAGNYDNAWDVDANRDYISPEARNAQKQAMDKTFALTDTKETPEEQLMREVARRNQERDLRSSKAALDSQLRTRGAYGSGAELAGFLGSQQELAQRRSLEEMMANANAQKRSMAALGQYGNQAFQLGQQDTTVGSLQDLNSRFNSTSQQNFQQFKTKTQQQENDAAAKRSASKTDAQLGVENTKRADLNSIADRKTQLTGMKTGNNTNMVGAAGQASSNLAGAYNNAAGNADARADKEEDLLGGIL